MSEAWRLLDAFGDRQVHLSEIDSASRHDRISRLAIAACRQVSYLIPDAVIPPEELGPELDRARAALPAASEVPEPRPAAGGWLPSPATKPSRGARIDPFTPGLPLQLPGN